MFHGRLESFCLLLVSLLSLPEYVKALGCFVCTSHNGSEPDCEDTFHNSNKKFYQQDCYAARKGRNGTFLGTECIKMKASHPDIDGYTITVRNCVVDNGDTNSETEIGRVNHCGVMTTIIFDDIPMPGCVVTCDSDACNTTPHLSPMTSLSLLPVIIKLFH